MRIKVPSVVPRLVPIEFVRTRFVLLEEIIEANIQALFPGMTPGPCHRFRVTRDADIEIKEEEAQDLLSVIQEEVRQRRFGTSFRLEVSPDMPEEMIEYLMASLDLDRDDVYVFDGPLDLQDLMSLYDIDRPDLKDLPSSLECLRGTTSTTQSSTPSARRSPVTSSVRFLRLRNRIHQSGG